MDAWIFLDMNQGFQERGKRSWATKVLLQVWETGNNLGRSFI